MKKSFLGLAVVYFVVMASTPAFAQKASEKVEKELIKLQNEWGDARIRGDVQFLEKLYAKEFRVVGINGSEISRAADIDNFASGALKPEMIKHEEVKVSVYGGVAIVTGIEKLRGTYKGNPGEFEVRFTSVYVRRVGRWQLVSHQGTEIRKPQMPPGSTTTQKEPSVFNGEPKDLLFGLTTAKWSEPYNGPLGYPKGAQRATLIVDQMSGGETYYARFPAGSRFEMHWHAHAEYAVVLSGHVTHFLGSERQSLKPGDYVIIPARTNHGWSMEAGEEVFLLIRRDGPADFNFVKD